MREKFLPIIDEPCCLEESIKKLKEEYPDGQLLFGSLAGGVKSIINCQTADKDVTAFVGPEGGMTEDEERMLAANGAVAVGLTETVLRVETAALALAAVLAAKRDFSV